jgi:hypothetical protein
MGAVPKQPGGIEPANVIEMFSRLPRGATVEELDQYRRLLPRLLQMLDEWEAVKGPGGCPIARRLTNPGE